MMAINLLLFFISTLKLSFLLVKVANGFNQDACLGQQIKIALLGDSLTRRSFVYFDLANLILQKLQNIQSRLNYNIEYNCLAIDVSKIIDVEVTQLWPAIDWKPNATIIFWDTDISDVDEYDMPSEEVTNIRNQFQVTVNTVVNTILNHTNNTNLALSIPGILGEDQVFKPSKFWHKVTMMNDYVNIVANICAQHNITYINMRQEYLKNIPLFRGAFPGLAFTRNFIKAQFFVTNDGEHPNSTGAYRDAQQFAQIIYDWFYANCTII